MNNQLEKLLASVSTTTFETVARGVLGDRSATLVRKPEFVEITSSHNDQRTIGIVKVSGRATTTVVGDQQDWSSVVKIIDPNVAIVGTDAARWVSVDIEQQVYELALFDDGVVPFRPAKCYLSQSNRDGTRFLWLEDLSNAPQPPWNLAQFIRAANHLGKFDGHYAIPADQLPFHVPDDGFYLRWGTNKFVADARELVGARKSLRVRESYQDTPVESAVELAALANRLFKTALSVPHSLAFGDSHARNLFPTEPQTVGIDWTALANEPTGVDIGVLIGSALSFGVEEAQMIASSERDIYESYLAGLQSAGWPGDLRKVRIGFFAQFAGYLATLASVPVRLSDYGDRRDWIEQRFGVPFDDIHRHLAPVIALIPNYVEELNQLLD